MAPRAEKLPKTRADRALTLRAPESCHVYGNPASYDRSPYGVSEQVEQIEGTVRDISLMDLVREAVEDGTGDGDQEQSGWPGIRTGTQ